MADVLEGQGWERDVAASPSVWTRRIGGDLYTIVVYVDDLLLECFTHADRVHA